MSYYPPSEGSYPGGGGGPYSGGSQQGFNQGHDQSYGAPQAGYGQAPSGYPSGAGGNPYNNTPGGYPQSDPYAQGPPGGYPGGYPDPSSVRAEDLPPGYNPATHRAYEPHELPEGASPAPEGMEGDLPCSALFD